MENREAIIELIAQTLAPRLYEMYGVKPEEMGFPICDTKEEVEDRLQKQFSPVEYWTKRGREIAESIIRIFEAGGVEMPFSAMNIDAMIAASAKERPDMEGRVG